MTAAQAQRVSVSVWVRHVPPAASMTRVTMSVSMTMPTHGQLVALQMTHRTVSGCTVHGYRGGLPG